MIKYLGSKRILLPSILNIIRGNVIPEYLKPFMSGVSSVVDLFSGTSRVGHALKGAGYRVLSNDCNAYAATLARCYVQSDAEDVLDDAKKLISEFNGLKGKPGYFTEHFCIRSRYFQPKNGERIDAIREAIAKKCLESELESVLLVSLMEAADRVDSTVGLQMAYLKTWSARSFKDLELQVPQVLPRAPKGKGQAMNLDVFDAIKIIEADLAYIDPPYNQHSYLGNYHIWESLVLWDKPEVYGVACKRIDVKEKKSIFNSKPLFSNAMRKLLEDIRTPILLVSFSNEGYLSGEEMETILTEVCGPGRVITFEQDFKRYIGAQIGIYNPQGEKVGKVKHTRNKEYLYLAVKQ